MSRGGGPTYLAIQSQPPGSVAGSLRVTEQGEMIQAKFGMPGIAERSLELYTTATLEATLKPPADPPPSFRARMEEMSEVAQREGIAKRRLQLTWTDPLVKRVAQEGFDDRYGARPLQRKLDTLITTPLAKFLLQRPELCDAELEVDCDNDGVIHIRSASR